MTKTPQMRPNRAGERTIAGEHHASESDLFETLYTELEQRAAWQLRNLPPSYALHPTALVHEAYIKLRKARYLDWNNPAHFFAIAVKAMREVLADRLRNKLARKRRGEQLAADVEVTLYGRTEPVSLGVEDFLDLDNALDRLERDFPDHADVVLLRFFGGFTMDEIAAMEGKSRRTIERRWRFARDWLQSEMRARNAAERE